MVVQIGKFEYEAVIGSLSASEASVKVTGGKLADGEHRWWYFEGSDTASCFDESGEQSPVAKDLLCLLAAKIVHRRLT